MRLLVNTVLGVIVGAAVALAVPAGLAQTPSSLTAAERASLRAAGGSLKPHHHPKSVKTQTRPAEKPTPAGPASPKPTAKPAPSPPPKAAPPTVATAPVAVAPAAPGARLAAGTPIPPAELEALVDGAVREAMAEDHIAGVTVSVVQNGQIVLKKGYGFAGPSQPVDPDNTLFRLGSISKTFTWIAVMKETEAGRMRLAAPINLFLPENLQIKDQGFKRPILVRDLMTHSAGFEDRALGQLFEKDPRRVRPLIDYLRQERPRRVREAGELPVYSNYGAGLAGAAVAYVDSRPFQDIIESEIIQPLGLAHTTFREPYPATDGLPAPMPAALAQDLSTGYRWNGVGFEPQPFTYISQIAPAGAASSTAADMGRYMLMILGGGQLDGATIYNAATAHGFQTTLQSSAPGVNGWDDGFMEYALPGGFRGQGHNGDALWFKSSMVTVPALNLGVFVAVNTDTGGRLAQGLPQQIVARFYAPPEEPPRPGSPTLAADRAIYAGTYLTDRRPYSGLEKFVMMLKGQLKISVTDDGRLITGDRAWVPDGSGLFHQTQGTAVSAFSIEGGRAMRWFDPSGSVAFDRIGPLYQTRVLALAAVLTAIASIAVIIGLFTRDRRDVRQSPTQTRASLLQSTVALLWLIAMTGFALWASRTGNVAYVVYNWPGPWLMIASACALVAALLTVLTIVLIPAVWRGGRRVDSWTPWRKLRFTAITAVFAGFSVVLALWGALEPWSG